MRGFGIAFRMAATLLFEMIVDCIWVVCNRIAFWMAVTLLFECNGIAFWTAATLLFEPRVELNACEWQTQRVWAAAVAACIALHVLCVGVFALGCAGNCPSSPCAALDAWVLVCCCHQESIGDSRTIRYFPLVIRNVVSTGPVCLHFCCTAENVLISWYHYLFIIGMLSCCHQEEFIGDGTSTPEEIFLSIRRVVFLFLKSS